MVYERVHKSSGQSSSKKKHTPIVPPLIEQQTQADSQLSPKAMPSITPSIEEKDAINPQLFGDLTKINDTLARTQTSQQSTSNFSPQRKISALPSKEKRDAVYRQLFGNCTETDDVQSKTPESLSVAATPIQAKLTIGAPGDKYEQEADKVAAQVVNQINAPVAQQSNQNLQREDMSEEDELMMKSDTSSIQREAIPEEEEELQMKPMVQLQAGVGGMAATTELESFIQQARSGGQPLADNVRQSMEQAFGADFSGVKVHTDTQADQLNQSIQARAFTTGQDVFFRQGEYNLGSRGGQELIAHELTHVVQQNGGAVMRSLLPPEHHQHQLATEILSGSVSSGVIQAAYAENRIDNDVNITNAIKRHRQSESLWNYTGCQKNFAIDSTRPNLYGFSDEGGHSERNLLNKMLIQGYQPGTALNIHTERETCLSCDAHLKQLHDEAPTPFDMNVTYYVSYPGSGNSKDMLHQFYMDNSDMLPKRTP